MNKIVKIWSIILIIFLLIACQQATLKTSTFSHEPVTTQIYEKEASYQRTFIVFHNKGIVSKLEIIDKTIFNSEDNELIEEYAEIDKVTYEGEIFDFKGFSHSSKIEDNVFTSTVTLDYETMDMKKLIEEENWFVNTKDITNKDFNVSFDKLAKLILEDGCELID